MYNSKLFMHEFRHPAFKTYRFPSEIILERQRLVKAEKHAELMERARNGIFAARHLQKKSDRLLSEIIETKEKVLRECQLQYSSKLDEVEVLVDLAEELATIPV